MPASTLRLQVAFTEEPRFPARTMIAAACLLALAFLLSPGGGPHAAAGQSPAAELRKDPYADYFANYTQYAKAFCARPDFPDLTCEMAPEEEVNATLGSVSGLFAGTVWSGLVESLPTTLKGHDSYWQYHPRLLSLACHGLVTVRAVFKRTSSYEGWNGCLTLNYQPDGNITRCELVLPAGVAENEAAASAEEVNCEECAPCTGTADGCPLEQVDGTLVSWRGVGGGVCSRNL